jgi:3D (Asp-Asp-Asp) domain-containing protein
MKKMPLAAAFMAALISIAVAQDSRLPEASLDREVRVPVSGGAAVSRDTPHQSLTPPSYCKPCLFYAGDFDSDASDANGLANEFDVVVSTGATTYTPFIVPKGKTWTVTGLFTNNFMSSMTLDPKVIPYEVRKGIPKSGGNGGKLVCHGRKSGTLVFPFQCDDFGFSCYAAIVKTIKGCRLPAGKYWMSVVPYCTNTRDGACENSWRAFVANDDGAMVHRYGPLEPANDSFFNSVYFGANWEPSSEQQSSSRFSVGVEGTAK